MERQAAQGPGPAEGLAPEEHALGALTPRALAPQVLTGGVAPFVVYLLARHAGMADAAALAVSSVPPTLAVVTEWAWRRRLNVIGAIALVGIAAGLVSMALLHGDELLLKMRESVITGLFGLVCLVSLMLPGRPVMFHLGRSMAGGGDRSAEFDTLWERPEARRVFTVLTLAWGVGLVLEAALRAVLALELSTGSFLAVTPVVGWVVIAGLIYLTISYTRATRRQVEEPEQLEAEATA